MSVKELRWVATNYGLMNDLCSEKNVIYAFNMSKESQVNEISTEQLLQMNFIEFLEAFARIAEYAALDRFSKVPIIYHIPE